MAHKSVLITGTGTGIGKTFLSYHIASYLKERGVKVGYFKPIETGVEDIPQDGAKLCQVTGQSIKEAVAFTCKLPLAPYACTLETGMDFDVDHIKSMYNKLLERYDFLIVEGAGGLAVPIKKEYNYANLARELNIPILIVSYSTLGTIHHTYTTYFYAKAMQLSILGIILNGFKGEDVSEKTNAKIIQDLTNTEVIEVPYQEREAISPELLGRICRLIGF